MRRYHRNSEVMVDPGCRQRLIEFIRQNGPMKRLAESLEVSERSLYRFCDWQVRWFRRDGVQALCIAANVPLVLASETDESDFIWVPCTEEHLYWVTSVTPTVYNGDVSALETKLQWLDWHRPGYRAILHKEEVCGICECLSVTDRTVDRLVNGNLFESKMTDRDCFPDPLWPARHVLIQHLMIIDRVTNCREEHPRAFKSIVMNLPVVLRDLFGDHLDEGWVYGSPVHSHDTNKDRPASSERLMVRTLRFEQIQPRVPGLYKFFRIPATTLVSRLEELADTYR